VNGKVDNLQTPLTGTSNDREIVNAFRENWRDAVRKTDLVMQNIVLLGGISVARGGDRHRLGLPCSVRVLTQKDIVSGTLEWGYDTLAPAKPSIGLQQ